MINSKEILWVFSVENPLSIPSYIVSGIMPADNLKIQKIIFLKNHDPVKLLKNHKPKLIILSKAFHSGVYDLAKEAKKNNIKIVSIFDDWHFENKSDIIRERSELNLKLSKISEVVVSKTKAAAELIFQNTNIVSKVIPDCIRYKTINPVHDFQYPFETCWFGNYTNHKTIPKGLEEINNSNEKVNLQIITNKIEKIEPITKNLNENIAIQFVNWSMNIHQNVNESDIVIIPLFNNNNSYVKSSNRIVDSLNMGRFVIINDNHQYSEFRDYCFFGNVGDGLKWIKENKEKALQMIVKGQKYVLQEYGLKKICKKWNNILNDIN